MENPQITPFLLCGILSQQQKKELKIPSLTHNCSTELCLHSSNYFLEFVELWTERKNWRRSPSMHEQQITGCNKNVPTNSISSNRFGRYLCIKNRQRTRLITQFLASLLSASCEIHGDKTINDNAALLILT